LKASLGYIRETLSPKKKKKEEKGEIESQAREIP
jgi:hypothetical protein